MKQTNQQTLLSQKCIEEDRVYIAMCVHYGIPLHWQHVYILLLIVKIVYTLGIFVNRHHIVLLYVSNDYLFLYLYCNTLFLHVK